MKLTALEIPEDDAELAGWLERQLVGCDLGDLVAGLMAVRDADGAPSLDSGLEGQLGTILQSGLGALSPDELRGLLDTPLLLMELQERVFVEGGAYWDGVPRTDEHLAAADRVARRVSERLADGQPTLLPSAKATSRRVWMAYAVAASLLFGFSVWRTRSSTPTGWGFDRPGVLAQKLSAPDYLLMLAAAAGEWSNKTPDTREELLTRLTQFRAGCDSLLAAEHPQLLAKDKTWLLGRCRAWRAQIDALIGEVDGGKPVAEVRAAADALVTKMADTLRRRAEAIS